MDSLCSPRLEWQNSSGQASIYTLFICRGYRAIPPPKFNLSLAFPTLCCVIFVPVLVTSAYCVSSLCSHQMRLLLGMVTPLCGIWPLCTLAYICFLELAVSCALLWLLIYFHLPHCFTFSRRFASSTYFYCSFWHSNTRTWWGLGISTGVSHPGSPPQAAYL